MQQITLEARTLLNGTPIVPDSLPPLTNLAPAGFGGIPQITLAAQTPNGTPSPGSWTALTNLAPSSSGGIQQLSLLSNGVVMAQGGADSASSAWYALTPSANGDYLNGTWTSLKSMSLQRLFFASNTLPSGKLFVMGGEYSGPSTSQTLTNSGQIYDPAANSWSNVATFPQSYFGDDPTMVLPSGKILAGYIFSAATYLFDPVTNTWSTTGSKLNNDQSDEETWVMMPNGKVLSYNVFASPATGAGSAQFYDPSTGSWSATGAVPVPLSGNAFGYELGPATLLPNGNVFQVGANGNTAIYTPSTNTWVAGPIVPGSFQADDAPGAMLPNGHFIFAADAPPGIFNAPTKIFDYDYTTGTITDITPGGTLGSTLGSQPAFLERMLVLPSGNLLMTTGYAGSTQLYEYTPVGTPQAAWAPTVSNVTLSSAFSAASAFTLTGTQLNGISQGASYGDDAEADTNFPIVRITNSSGTVKYAKSFNWTPGVATGSTVVSTQFTMPAGFGAGTYTLNVIANGIASSNYTLQILAPPTNVSAVPIPGSTTTAQVSWTAVTGADLGYDVYWQKVSGNVLVATAPAGATTATAVGLVSGSQTLFVRALSSTYLGGEAAVPYYADSAATSVVVNFGLQAPTSVTGLVLSPTTARISWSPVAGDDLGYKIYQVGAPNVLIGTAVSGASTVLATGLTPGATDTIFVEVFSSTLTPFHVNSTTINLVMPAVVGTPFVSVSGITAVNSTTATAILHWSSVANINGYRIYEQIFGQRFLVGYAGSGVTQFTLAGLRRGVTVTFIVEAYRGFVFSDGSTTFTPA